MLRSEELNVEISNKMEELKVGKKLTNEAKREILDAIKQLKEDVALELEIENSLKVEIEIENKIEEKKDGVVKMENKKEVANVLRLMISDMAKNPLTVEEMKALSPYKIVDAVTGGDYLLPQDISTVITEKIKMYQSLETVLGAINTGDKTGSFVVDGTDDTLELVDVVDGIDMTDSNNLAFINVTFAMKCKGGLMALTNTILRYSDTDLINYIAGKFAKRYINTVNKMGITVLKSNKTVKPIADVKALIKSIQVDIDPLALQNSVIVTNQDAFSKLCDKEDGKMIKYIQPDLTKEPILMVNGLQVVVMSNKMMPTVATKAPIFYGNLADSCQFVKSGVYELATDSSVGFKANVTFARLITYIDAIQTFKADDIYIYGEITV